MGLPTRAREPCAHPSDTYARAKLTRRYSMAETYSGDAYCVKCKEKRQIEGQVEEKNGRRFAKGVCPVCGTKVTRIMGKA